LKYNCPRIVIGGVQSGVGKTSVSLALVCALRRRGLRVQTFKVGPDFLDPTYLAHVSGRPCYNLDPWMSSADYVRRLVARVSRDADVSVIEGVMGLFDGADASSLSGSTAEVAKLLEAPVLLVARAHGMARSLAAMVQGYAEFEPGVRVAGVLANEVGSQRHADLLAESLASAGLPPLVGSIARGGFPPLPSRHLGLVSADARILSPDVESALAHAIEDGVDLEAVLKLAVSSPEMEMGTGFIKQESPERVGEGLRLGVARDVAFHFYYCDFFEELKARGCEIVEFSPIGDRALPVDLDGLYLGGGYPEEFAEGLSQNQDMLNSVLEFSRERPVYAECGGLVYLSQGIETLDGQRSRFAGVLPFWTRMLPKRKALGYVEARLEEDLFWGQTRTVLRGHEFHYSEIEGASDGYPGWRSAYRIQRRRSQEWLAEGYWNGRVLASYAHLHLASKPDAVERFLRNLRTVQQGGKSSESENERVE
jgi:cobyrinic acid a,c-diamide synthase